MTIHDPLQSLSLPSTHLTSVNHTVSHGQPALRPAAAWKKSRKLHKLRTQGGFAIIRGTAVNHTLINAEHKR